MNAESRARHTPRPSLSGQEIAKKGAICKMEKRKLYIMIRKAKEEIRYGNTCLKDLRKEHSILERQHETLMQNYLVLHSDYDTMRANLEKENEKLKKQIATLEGDIQRIAYDDRNKDMTVSQYLDEIKDAVENAMKAIVIGEY